MTEPRDGGYGPPPSLHTPPLQPVAYPDGQNRKRPKWPYVVTAVVVLLCAIGIGVVACVGNAVDQATPKIGVATTPSDPNEPANESDPARSVKVGTTLETSGPGSVAAYTVTKTETKTSSEFSIPKSGHVFLLAHVKVAVAEGSEYVCSCSFAYVSKAGKVYDATWESFKGRDDLSATQVAAGQNTDGWVAFEVPKAGVADGKIQFTLNAFTDASGFWSLR
jgi:hypothetical protein